MRQTKPTAGDRAPFLLMGVLCWLCGAVVVGVATQLVFGWVEAAVALAVLTAFVLAVFWSLSSSAPASRDKLGAARDQARQARNSKR